MPTADLPKGGQNDGMAVILRAKPEGSLWDPSLRSG